MHHACSAVECSVHCMHFILLPSCVVVCMCCCLYGSPYAVLCFTSVSVYCVESMNCFACVIMVCCVNRVVLPKWFIQENESACLFPLPFCLQVSPGRKRLDLSLYTPNSS